MSFSDCLLFVHPSVSIFSYFQFLLQNHRASYFNQNILFTDERPYIFQREIIATYRKYICLTTFNLQHNHCSPMSTKLGAKHSSAMEIQVCSNEGPRGDIMMTILKYFDISSWLDLYWLNFNQT